MRQFAEETDTLNIRHQHFQLYYKGIPVEGVMYSLHSRDKRLRVANGQMVENLMLDVSKPMAEARALALALAAQNILASLLKGCAAFWAGAIKIGKRATSERSRLDSPATGWLIQPALVSLRSKSFSRRSGQYG